MMTSADRAAIVARKQRRPCIESGGVATTDAVAARITGVIIARGIAPTCVRIIVAIVVVVVPRRGGSGDYSRQHSVSGCRPAGLSTRNPGNPDWGRRSIDPSLGAFDPQRNSAVFRPTERQQCHTRNGRGCDYYSFQNHFHGFSPSLHPAFRQCTRDQPTGRRARESIACSAEFWWRV
jgi:hypothetical protein